MDSLVIAKLVDDITDMHSKKICESVGQGVADIIAGAFGDIGGCAMLARR